MNREELRSFCELEDFARFQEKLNTAPEADVLDILSYLLADGLYEEHDKRLQSLSNGLAAAR